MALGESKSSHDNSRNCSRWRCRLCVCNANDDNGKPDDKLKTENGSVFFFWLRDEREVFGQMNERYMCSEMKIRHRIRYTFTPCFSAPLRSFPPFSLSHSPCSDRHHHHCGRRRCRRHLVLVSFSSVFVFISSQVLYFGRWNYVCIFKQRQNHSHSLSIPLSVVLVENLS